MNLATYGADLTLIWWKDNHQYIGKFKEYSEIFNRGDTLEELKENITSDFKLKMVLDINDSIGEPEVRKLKRFKKSPAIPDIHSTCDVHIETLAMTP